MKSGVADGAPAVSVIVPCRNEEKFIRPCLDSILQNDYPKDRLEVLVLDGMSEDKTKDIVDQVAFEHPQIRLISNLRQNVCAAMNLGIQEAKGEIIFKMDAHATYGKDYIARCVLALENSGADNVGGRFSIESGNGSLTAKGIALAMAHPFGVGPYYQWMNSLRKPTEVETVSFGCFKKDFLKRNRLSFNEELERGGDSEFNLRLRQKGGRVMLIPDIVFRYFARPDLKGLWRHQFSCGFWVVYWTKFGCKPTFRSFLPMLFVLNLCFLLGAAFISSRGAWLLMLLLSLYGLVSFGFSFNLAVKQKDMKFLFLMPLVFATLHIGRGLGSCYGAYRRFM